MTKQVIEDNRENPFTGLQLWKVVGIFALVYAAVQLASGVIGAGMQFLMDAVDAGDNLRVFLGSTISHAGMAAAILLITLPVIRSAFNKPGLAGLFPSSGNQWKDLLIGMAIAACAMTVIFFIEYALGFIAPTGFALSGSPLDGWVRAIWLALLVNGVAALGAEVLYRGLLMLGVEAAWDRWGALFISSIIFGGAQIFSSGTIETDWLKFVPLMALPGVMLGWAYLRTGNLWLATGIHFAWNLFQNDILNLAGLFQGETLFGLRTTISGPQWFIGGSLGFETGAAGILCLLLVSAGIWWWTRRVKE